MPHLRDAFTFGSSVGIAALRPRLRSVFSEIGAARKIRVGFQDVEGD